MSERRETVCGVEQRPRRKQFFLLRQTTASVWVMWIVVLWALKAIILAWEGLFDTLVWIVMGVTFVAWLWDH